MIGVVAVPRTGKGHGLLLCQNTNCVLLCTVLYENKMMRDFGLVLCAVKYEIL